MAISLEGRLAVARRALGRSVVAINPCAAEEAAHKRPGYACVGVKDSADIPAELIERFSSSPDWLLLTVDRMSDLGRSVDTELVNPLTYRPMTGSTSGGAVNVVKGICDVCIGTDGGGSVLAPALATNTFALMGKGLGLVAGEGRSTEGMSFTGGVGFIGRSLELVVRAAELAAGVSLEGFGPVGLLRVVVPAAGFAELPGGEDMRGRLDGFLGGLRDCRVEERRFSDLYEREVTVAELRQIWDEDPTACVVSFEGPIDVFSADETIPRGFGGVAPSVVAGVRSKAACKAVNMAGGSAVCVPTDELACGLVVACGPGVEAARGMAWLARQLASGIQLPAMHVRYFLDRSKEPRPVEVFEGGAGLSTGR